MPRYIDADLLTETMRNRYDEICETYGYHDLYASGYDDAVDAVENAPTADVAPRAEVAMEIFAEIEKVLNQEYTEIEERMKRTKDPDAQDGMEGELCGLDYALYLVSEIRKKYTDATDIGDGHKEGE
jgi:hypothetical protein